MRTDRGFRMVGLMVNHIEHVEEAARLRAWGRVFAALYDPLFWAGERAGLRAHRRALLSEARGRTLEIGSGMGLNLAHYPKDLEEVVLTEPDAAMRSQLQKRLRRRGRPFRLVNAPAERLPFADGWVDTVVSTFVLCTVDAPDLVVREIARVLRPGGTLLFIEHVRSDSPGLARWQDRLAKPWGRFARGCRCNRATTQLIAASGFDLDHVTPASWRRMPPIVAPLSIGRARKQVTTSQLASPTAPDARRAQQRGEPSRG
jgi:SAM-dependent methyltransferase